MMFLIILFIKDCKRIWLFLIPKGMMKSHLVALMVAAATVATANHH